MGGGAGSSGPPAMFRGGSCVISWLAGHVLTWSLVSKVLLGGHVWFRSLIPQFTSGLGGVGVAGLSVPPAVFCWGSTRFSVFAGHVQTWSLVSNLLLGGHVHLWSLISQLTSSTLLAGHAQTWSLVSKVNIGGHVCSWSLMLQFASGLGGGGGAGLSVPPAKFCWGSTGFILFAGHVQTRSLVSKLLLGGHLHLRPLISQLTIILGGAGSSVPPAIFGGGSFCIFWGVGRL